jgi:hypothetical protein
MLEIIVVSLNQPQNGKCQIIDVRLSSDGTKVFWSYHGAGIAYLCPPLSESEQAIVAAEMTPQREREETLHISFHKVCEEMAWEIIDKQSCSLPPLKHTVFG